LGWEAVHFFSWPSGVL